MQEGRIHRPPQKQHRMLPVRGLPPREGDSPRPPRAPHCVAASEKNWLPCETFMEVFSSNSEGIIIKFYSHPFSILWEKKERERRVGKGMEACLLVDTVRGGLICGHFQRQEEFRQPETLFFSKVTPSPHPHPPKKNQNVLHETIVYEALISRN